MRSPNWWQQAAHAARPHSTLLFLLVITLVKGVLWSAAIPFGQAPDEISHFGLIQFIAEFGRLPRLGEDYVSDELLLTARRSRVEWVAFHSDHQQTFAEGNTIGPDEPAIRALDPALRRTFEFQEPSTAQAVPPLYHALAALGYRLLYDQDLLARLFAARLVSVLLAALLVVVAYGLVRDLTPGDPAMRLTVLIVVSFQPMVTYLGAVANSDILLFLIFGFIVWVTVRTLQHGLKWQYAVALGIALGLGILTKPMTLTCGLGIAILFMAEWTQRPKERLRLLYTALLVLGLMLVIGGWYIARNYNLHGTLLYRPALVSDPEFRATNMLQPRPNLTVLEYWREIYYPRLRNATFESYWGEFGWLDTPMSSDVYQILHWVCNTSFIGLLLSGISALLQRPVPWLRLLVFSTLALLAVSLVVPLTAQGYTLARDIGWPHAALQGRYYLAAWLPQAVLLVCGLVGFVRRRVRPLAHLSVRLGIIALNIYALAAVILPRYYL